MNNGAQPGQQAPPEVLQMRPPPFTHLEVRPGTDPNMRVLMVMDHVGGVLRQIPMHVKYAEELGKELTAPRVLVAPASINGQG
jgi:hypothetical protein